MPESEEEKPGSLKPTNSKMDSMLLKFPGFMDAIYRCNLIEVVWCILEHASINDDRQHSSEIGLDLSPLFFAIAGATGHLPPPDENAIVIEWLLAHPGVDPNRGSTTFGGDASSCTSTRESPLLVRRSLRCACCPH
jgi:hypothetical protein